MTEHSYALQLRYLASDLALEAGHAHQRSYYNLEEALVAAAELAVKVATKLESAGTTSSVGK